MLLLMESLCPWKPLKSSLTILLCCQVLIGATQSWEKVSSFTSNGTIVSASIDNQSNLYIATEKGELVKLSPQLKEIQHISVPNRNTITLIEARNSLAPFVFSRGNQEIIVYDRFLSNPVIYPVSQFSDRFAWLMTPSLDQQFWLLQNSPPSILKIDRNLGIVLQDAQLPIDFALENVSFMRAEKGVVILADTSKGVYIFDLFGNKLAQIDFQGAQHAQLVDQVVFTCNEEKLYQLNLSKSRVDSISLPGRYSTALKSGGDFLLIKEEVVDLYSLSN